MENKEHKLGCGLHWPAVYLGGDPSGTYGHCTCDVLSDWRERFDKELFHVFSVNLTPEQRNIITPKIKSFIAEVEKLAYERGKNERN